MTILDRLDSNLTLDETETMVLQSVSSMARGDLMDRAADLDRSGDFPWANVHAINELGLNTMFIPEQYGR